MKPPHLDGDVAGICHKRGGNADIPTQWMPYFIVADIQDSLQAVKQRGGEAITAVKSFGDSQFVIIKDPAGAVCALYQE
jgi:predicted enzyme related to lactoylglutathione lyase